LIIVSSKQDRFIPLRGHKFSLNRNEFLNYLAKAGILMLGLRAIDLKRYRDLQGIWRADGTFRGKKSRAEKHAYGYDGVYLLPAA
jgi:hypothetical protein